MHVVEHPDQQSDEPIKIYVELLGFSNLWEAFSVDTRGG